MSHGGMRIQVYRWEGRWKT